MSTNHSKDPKVSAPRGRRRIVAGNWKMVPTRDEAVALARGVVEATTGMDRVDVVVMPPTCLIGDVAGVVCGTHVGLGAQNVHHEASGAFTGEVSAAMLTSIGCVYVICGHSERRAMFGDTPEWVGDKVAAAHAGGLIPILCVGETLAERQDGRTEDVVGQQLEAGIAKLDPAQIRATIVAYEPVWAIGTGQTATPAQAQEIHAFIRRLLATKHGRDVADAVRIQYGGSVKPANAAELLSQPDIDGALVGGASLKADSFAGICGA